MKIDSGKRKKLMLYNIVVTCMVSSFFVAVFFGLCTGFLAIKISYTLFLIISLLILREEIKVAIRASSLNVIPLLASLFGLLVIWTVFRC